MTSVTNTGHNPVEAAGRVFPPRRTIDVDLDERQVEVVHAHRRLHLADEDTADVDLEQLTNAQLRDQADAAGIQVPAKATKAELVAALHGADGGG